MCRATEYFEVIETYESEEAASESGDLVIAQLPDFEERLSVMLETSLETPLYELTLFGTFETVEAEAEQARKVLKDAREADVE